MDNKVSRVLTDTETLLTTYRKKIQDISKNVENMGRYKMEVTSAIDKL
jgi:hypothetical protein